MALGIVAPSAYDRAVGARVGAFSALRMVLGHVLVVLPQHIPEPSSGGSKVRSAPSRDHTLSLAYFEGTCWEELLGGFLVAFQIFNEALTSLRIKLFRWIQWS